MCKNKTRKPSVLSRVWDLHPPLVGSLFSRDFVVQVDLFEGWEALGQAGHHLHDPFGTLSLGGAQEGSFWRFYWKEGWVTLLKISLRWIWAVVLQMQPCPALVNLQSQAWSVWENLNTKEEGCRLFPCEERNRFFWWQMIVSQFN